MIALLQRDCVVPMELAMMHADREHVLPQHVVPIGLPRLHAHHLVRSSP